MKGARYCLEAHQSWCGFNLPKLHPEANPVRVQPAMEPDDVLWENLGNPIYQKFIRGLAIFVIIVFELFARYFVQWAFTIIEKNKNLSVNMDCAPLKPNFPFSDDVVLADYKAPREYQRGLMNCFCENLYKT